MRALSSRPVRPRVGLIVGIITMAAALAACAGPPQPESTENAAEASAGGAFPMTIANCGHTVTVPEPPDRAVANTSGATEVILALGLEDHLVGTVSREFRIDDRWQKAYASVPVLADTSISQEALLAAKPDFVYSTFDSPFQAKRFGSRDELAAFGIPTYVAPSSCPDVEGVSWDMLWREITEIARIFGVPQRGEDVVDRLRQRLNQIRRYEPGEGITVFWWAGGGTDTPKTWATPGNVAGMFLKTVGASNAVEDLPEDGGSISWERVLAADPGVLILTDSPVMAAEERINYLESDPVLSQLTAVKKQRYVIVRRQDVIPGPGMVYGVQSLAEQLAAFDELARQ